MSMISVAGSRGSAPPGSNIDQSMSLAVRPTRLRFSATSCGSSETAMGMAMRPPDRSRANVSSGIGMSLLEKVTVTPSLPAPYFSPSGPIETSKFPDCASVPMVKVDPSDTASIW